MRVSVTLWLLHSPWLIEEVSPLSVALPSALWHCVTGQHSLPHHPPSYPHTTRDKSLLAIAQLLARASNCSACPDDASTADTLQVRAFAEGRSGKLILWDTQWRCFVDRLATESGIQHGMSARVPEHHQRTLPSHLLQPQQPQLPVSPSKLQSKK